MFVPYGSCLFIGKKGRKGSESEDEPVYPSYEIAPVIDLGDGIVSFILYLLVYGFHISKLLFF